MRKAMIVLCILGLVAAAASPAGAITFTFIDISIGDGKWLELEFGGVGSWPDNFTFTVTVTETPAILKVTDPYRPGDQFDVFDNGFFFGNPLSFGIGSLDYNPVQPVAIVGTLFLFGTGLVGLLLIGLRRRMPWQNPRMTPLTRQNPFSAPLCTNEKPGW
jgi:hypothetical protein